MSVNILQILREIELFSLLTAILSRSLCTAVHRYLNDYKAKISAKRKKEPVLHLY